jgi:hypothetical protein
MTYTTPAIVSTLDLEARLFDQSFSVKRADAED